MQPVDDDRGPPLLAGEVDWRARWRAQAEAARLVPARGEDRWAARAARFARKSRAAEDDGFLEVIGELVTPEDVVVDIGAGTGRYVPALARTARRVIALEPSAAMRAHLERLVADEGLTNVTVAPEAWPAEVPGGFDVALSAHVLYAVDDAEVFLRAMSAARRSCVLYLAPRPPSTVNDALKRAVLGQHPPRPPGALEALALLWQLGEEADLRVLPRSAREVTFSTSGEDLRELCHRLDLEPSPENLERTRAGLERVGRPTPEGHFVVGVSGPHAVITWRPALSRELASGSRASLPPSR